jgi:uncharacterized protein YecE (DUF72 family)
MGEVRIGVSGWSYPEWRGNFYPKGLVQKRELEYASRQMNSIEINGSFYSLQSPESYRKWAAETPDDFLFSLKGSKFITHTKKLADARVPLANFFASGVLLLGDKLGPIVWQLPPWFRFDGTLVSSFMEMLPADTREAAKLAEENTIKTKAKRWTEIVTDKKLRYAFEPRHQSFFCSEFIEMLGEKNAALAIADTGGKWPYAEDITADFIYLRLHGEELYSSNYSEVALKRWARKIKKWRSQNGSPKSKKAFRDVYVYFDNTAEGHAPDDAKRLADLLDA